MSLPALRGAVLALIAAVLFGVTTPLLQRAGSGTGAFTTAALLYAGAAVAGWLSRGRREQEAPLRRTDLPRLSAIAAFGAVIAPVALAWGLQRTSAASASLMLTLEAVFTAVFAWWLYRESVDRRVAAALVALTTGGALLVLDRGTGSSAGVAGLVAVVVATAAWAADNALSRALAGRDPGQVVFAKGALGALATTVIALVIGEPLPKLGTAAAIAALGATGYGLSLRFYLLGQRAVGAARTASVFAFAPFIGALLAIALGDRSGGLLTLAGAALMIAGVALHIAEKHAHEHTHDALQHEHAHVHDDGHHDHVHSPMPTGPHSHWHEHGAIRHTHPHVPDLHHTHEHDAKR